MLLWWPLLGLLRQVPSHLVKSICHSFEDKVPTNFISMARCKTAVFPLLTHWRYCTNPSICRNLFCYWVAVTWQRWVNTPITAPTKAARWNAQTQNVLPRPFLSCPTSTLSISSRETASSLKVSVWPARNFFLCFSSDLYRILLPESPREPKRCT